MVEFISMEPCTHPAGYVCNACAEGIRWFPHIRVDKYSVDQTSFAERKLAEELSWGRKVQVRASGLLTSVLHGDWLRELFPEPEDGIARDYGNSLVQGGLNNIVFLLMGSVAAPNGIAFKPAATGASFAGAGTIQTGVGVGSDATAWALTQTHLNPQAADGTNTWYQIMDATYPQWQGANTGQLNGQCTIASGNGNFAWQDWCWFTGTAVSAGVSTIAAAATNPLMLNRKVTSLGTKGAGASWVFSQTITFS